ncbi:excinuclease ABC subunit C [Listeria marthii]|uniref:excinuclease ABC subunit UvrC n=1 Tax=Listeria marthii TaxID=529731 RepID=UPI00162328B8|nr:excinuclease ABC subunit UvrC [Listeria marthii]MBC2011622.1 excinuclease ABC subunit C [Listeria marthii]
MDDKLQTKLTLLPESPGCYIYRDENNEILYIGKSKCLKNRVKSYFHSKQIGKTARLVRQIRDLELIITTSEKEALLLEMILIQKYQPPFNIQLKEGPSYPYIKITNEKNPHIEVVLEVKQDGAHYFGPYPGRYSARQTVELIEKLFPLCRCDGKPGRPCLYYHLGLCLGPCHEEIEPAIYENQIRKISRFLEGDIKDVKDKLTTEMQEAIEKLEFERAAELRDKMQAINETIEKQHIIFPGLKNRDIIGCYQQDNYLSVFVFFVRNGAINGSKWHVFEIETSLQDDLANFINHFYEDPNNIQPRELLIAEKIDKKLLQESLRKACLFPQKGGKKKQIDLAIENAKSAYIAYAKMKEYDFEKEINNR